MQNPFRKLKPGDTDLSHEAWNAFIDLAVRSRQGRQNVDSAEIASETDPAVIKVKNNTGDKLPRFSVVGFDDVLISPSDHEDGFTERVALSGRVPQLPDDAGRFAITLEQTDDGEITYAIVVGAAMVKVDVGDEADTFAEAVDGDVSKLESTAEGTATQILWKESGTGLKWAVVRLIGGAGETEGQYQGEGNFMVAQHVKGWIYTPVVADLS
jgi:hypothetical protein